MKVGDLVKCIEGPCTNVDGGTGIVIQVEDYNSPFDPPGRSVNVLWSSEDLWYYERDLEVINESR